MRLALRAVVIAVVLCLARDALGDPVNLRTRDPATLITDRGRAARVPPGRFLSEDLWQKLDREVKRLQDAETRLAAENKSLRESADAPGWGWVIGAGLGLAAGIAIGVRAF